jgi:hypothetical protein
MRTSRSIAARAAHHVVSAWLPVAFFATMLSLGCDGAAVRTNDDPSGGNGKVVLIPGQDAAVDGAGGNAPVDASAGDRAVAKDAGARDVAAAGHGGAGAAGSGGAAAGSSGAAGVVTTSGSAGASGAGGMSMSGGGTSGAAGAMQSFAACTTCEKQVCGAMTTPPPTGNTANILAASQSCFMSPGVAAAGPAKGMPRAALCQAVLDCVHTTHCNALQDLDCWCGIGADAMACLTPSFPRNGPCKQVIENAAETTNADTLPERYYDWMGYALGAAFFLVDDCDHDARNRPGKGPCESQCNGSGGGAAGAGSVGSAGVSGGAGIAGAAGGAGTNGAGAGGAGSAGGSAGDSGASGNSGSAGTAGAAGAPGTAGAAGTAGAGGMTGAGGTTGEAGTTGAAGAPDAGDAGDASQVGGGPGAGGSPVPSGGKACGAPSGGLCPDLDADTVLDCTQTAPMNPGFDAGIASWHAEDQIVLSWNATGDLNGNASSGALTVRNPIVFDNASWIMQGATQCVPVMGGAAYDFAAQVSIADGQGSGGAVVAFYLYPTADCSGSFSAANLSTSVTTTAMCEVLTMSQTMAADTRSVQVRLTALKPFRQPSFEVQFDNVLFRKH